MELVQNIPVINRHQYDGVQALRFLAALLVVISHSFFYTNERLGAGEVGEWANGAHGVDIFFVISGFVMIVSSHNLIAVPQGWLKFAVQRVTRIVPLYWTATSIKLLVMLLGASGLVLHADLNILNVLKSYFFIPYEKLNGKFQPLLAVGWTLVFEMFFYFVFTLGLLLKVNIYLFVWATMIVCAGLSLLRPVHYSVWMFFFDPIVLEFCYGMIVGYLTLKQRFLGALSAIFIIVITALLLIFLPGSSLSRAFDAGIPAALLVYSIVSIEPRIRDRIPKSFLFFGAASYSLYLFHPLFLPVIPVLLNKIQIHNVMVSVMLCILSSLVVAASAYRIIELPIIHAFRRMSFMAALLHKPVIEIK